MMSRLDAKDNQMFDLIAQITTLKKATSATTTTNPNPDADPRGTEAATADEAIPSSRNTAMIPRTFQRDGIIKPTNSTKN